MKGSLLVCLILTAFASGATLAQQSDQKSMDLAKAKNCFTCHSVDKKIVGPAFKDVAAKYAGQKDIDDKLAKKVLAGGSGVWGAVPMPANSQVTSAEAHTLVHWVLSQK